MVRTVNWVGWEGQRAEMEYDAMGISVTCDMVAVKDGRGGW